MNRIAISAAIIVGVVAAWAMCVFAALAGLVHAAPDINDE